MYQSRQKVEVFFCQNIESFYKQFDNAVDFSVPTSPTNLRVRAEHPGELHITWDPPLKPNGNVTHYEVYWQLRDLDRKNYELRDYCAYRKFKEKNSVDSSSLLLMRRFLECFSHITTLWNILIQIVSIMI